MSCLPRPPLSIRISRINSRQRCTRCLAVDYHPSHLFLFTLPALAKFGPTMPSLRYPRFSLRALLLVVFVVGGVGGWAGSAAFTVRTRTAMLGRIHAIGGWSQFTSGDSSIPWIRRVMGDHAATILYLPIETPVADRRRIKEVFPEADIFAFRGPLLITKGSGIDRAIFPFPDTDGK